MSTDACCNPGARPTHTAQGSHIELASIDCYVTGESDRIVFWNTDVFGNSHINTKQAADEIANRGFRVIVPDYFAGEGFDPIAGTDRAKFPQWLEKNSVKNSLEIAKKIYYSLLSYYPNTKSIGLISFCYGSKVGFQLLNELENNTKNNNNNNNNNNNTIGIKYSIHAHPSFLTVEDAKTTPMGTKLLFICAENDHLFTNELRKEFFKILTDRNIEYSYIDYPLTTHGFCIRGDQRDGYIEEMRIKAMNDMAEFFKNNLI